MSMKRKLYFLVVGAVALLFSSCGSSKKFVYLQDMEMGQGYPYDTKYEAVVHANDRLDITVSSKSPELAVPFNANGGSFQVGVNGAITESGWQERLPGRYEWRNRLPHLGQAPCGGAESERSDRPDT